MKKVSEDKDKRLKTKNDTVWMLRANLLCEGLEWGFVE